MNPEKNKNMCFLGVMLPSEPFAFEVFLKTRNEEGVYVGYHRWHNLKHLLIHFDSEDAKDHIAGLCATSVFEG